MNYDKRLGKHMDNLKVLTNDALFYHKEKQWVMLDVSTIYPVEA